MPQRTGYSPPPFVRTNFPPVTSNYTLQPTDEGCVASQAGITITLPAIASKLPGRYTVKNASAGNITLQTNGNEVGGVSTGTWQSMTIKPDNSEDFNVSTNTNYWYIV